MPRTFGSWDEEVPVSVVANVKEYLAEDRHKVRLRDAVADEVRRLVSLSGDGRFAVSAAWSDDEWRRRIPAYDELFADMSRVEALIAWWGNEPARETLTLSLKRLCDSFSVANGNTGWLALRWYPVLSLLYAGGVAAIAANRYGNLWELMDAKISASACRSGKEEPVVVAAAKNMNDIMTFFKLLPGLERRYTPFSEHLHALLQTRLDDLFFLGSDYERAFDRFEVLFALEYAHRTDRGWGPIGRFGWKAVDRESSPLQLVIVEAQRARNAWPPLLAGLFDGSFDRFSVVAQQLAELLARNPML